MIEPLSAPGMAVDIRLSTLEPVQQLGARLAQVLSGELSRLRADAAFAMASGIAVHAPAAQSDTLRAQQTSVLGNTMIGLTSRPTSLEANPDFMIRDAEMNRRRRAGELDEQPVDERRDRRDRQEHNQGQGQKYAQDQIYEQEWEQEDHGDLRQRKQADRFADLEILATALNAALDQCQQLSSDIGLTGALVAVALPAKYWVETYSPADLRCRAELAADMAGDNDVGDLLVLCLSFDGSLGHSRALFGLLFIADTWVGSLHTQWSRKGPAADTNSNTCEVSVQKPAACVSVVTAAQDSSCCIGMRVKIDVVAAEPEQWFWNAAQWTWH